MRGAPVVLACIAGCVAPLPPCTDGVCGVPPELADDGTSMPGTAGDDGQSTGATPTGSTGATTDGPGPVCGDGTLDPDEDCDDGNSVDGDGCNADCMPSLRTLDQTIFDGGAMERDVGRDIGVDADGDIVVVGSFRAGNVDTGFVLGLDPDLEVRFVDLGDTPGASGQLLAVAVNPAGFAAVAGTVGTGDGADARLLFYDPRGVRSWDASFDGADALEDQASDILFDPFGQLYAIGLTKRMDGTSAVLLLQYTADGLAIGDAALDPPPGASIIPRGLDYAAMSTLVFAGAEVSGGVSEIVVSTITLDPFGSADTAHAGAPLGTAEASAVVVDGSGDVVAVGVDAGQGWAAKYTPDLATVWARPLDGVSDLFGVVTVPTDQSFHVVGDIDGPGGDNDVFVAHLAADGDELARTSIDLGGLIDSGRAIARAPDGTLLVTGETEGPTGFDVFVLRLAP